MRPYYFSKREPCPVAAISDSALHDDCPEGVEWLGSLMLHTRADAWIRSNRGRWPYDIPDYRLDFDCHMERAGAFARSRELAFEEAYPPWVREGLNRLIQALNRPEAGILDSRRSLVAYKLNCCLRNNAVLAAERQRHSQIACQRIDRPVFIVGANRTGTTFLHRLLARDTRFRTLRNYEAMELALPRATSAAAAHGTDDPRRVAWIAGLKASGLAEALSGIHPIEADEAEEDFPLLEMTFSSWTFTVSFRIPEFGRWLASLPGTRKAYTHHRRVMQYVTWQRALGAEASGRWLFKMPTHLMELEALTDAYPDALFIQTHRHPREFMGSWVGLTNRIRSIVAQGLPLRETGPEQMDFMHRMLTRGMAFRRANPDLEDRWLDIGMDELIRNPLQVVGRIYEHVGCPAAGPEVTRAMTRWLAREAERRKGEVRHRYGLEECGLASDAVSAAFEPYLQFAASRGIRMP